MNGQAMLQMHPSVQDLEIDTFKVNPAKAHYHSLVINNSPLHAPSELTKPKKSKGKVVMEPVRGKGVSHVQAVRNEENLKQAALARLVPSEVNALPPVAPKKLGASLKTNKQAMSMEKGKEVRPSSQHGSSTGPSTTGGLNADTLRALETMKEDHDPLKELHRPSSIVTSRVSFEATDAASFSVYSCSCCHAKPLSSHLRSSQSKRASTLRRSVCSTTPLSDYEHMTSVSQRPSNHPSAMSVTSTKLRSLEEELLRERESRLKTLTDLETVRKRQQLLLSKLTPAEREQFKELVES